MYWRTVNLSQLPKEERKHVRKMCRLFALKSEPQEELSPEEQAEKAREGLAQRYGQARRGRLGGYFRLRLGGGLCYRFRGVGILLRPGPPAVNKCSLNALIIANLT